MSLRTLRSLWGWSSIAHHLRYLFGVYPLVILQNQRWHHEESHHDKYSMRCQSTIYSLGFQYNKKEKKVKSFLARILLRSGVTFGVSTCAHSWDIELNEFHIYILPCIVLKIVFTLTTKISNHHRVVENSQNWKMEAVRDQTRETVFHQDIQTPKRELKIQHAVEYLWRNSRCLDSPWDTLSSVWYIFSMGRKTKV